MSDLTECWCRENLASYDVKEDAVAVDFIFAKCENGSDAMVTFNKVRPSQKDAAKVFVSNFYVERVKTVDDLRALVRALGFGNDRPWKCDPIEIPKELYTPRCRVACHKCGGDSDAVDFESGNIPEIGHEESTKYCCSVCSFEWWG